jgi:hypothetical protein
VAPAESIFSGLQELSGNSMDSVITLHATLRRRETPETVAKLIRDVLPDQQAKYALPFLAEVIRQSVKGYFGWSSMATTFKEPSDASVQIAKVRELVFLFLDDQLSSGDDLDALDAIIDDLDGLIAKTRGRSSFRDDRPNRAARTEHGLSISRRRYGKLFRLAVRLERKAARLREEQAKLELILVSKAALAPRLKVEDFGGDVTTAAFVAYYAARMKLRSEFTISGQQRPFDKLSASLLNLCNGSSTTSWWAIAHVFPRSDVLARLTDDQRGQLLGIWFDILQVLSDRLDAVQSRSAINMDTMVVKRGNDSTTWNVLAGAWNRARDHWLALVEAMGMEALFDTMQPGKVMRLMAADVAAWHASQGQGTHPDTLVWRSLPRPWLVLRGEAICTRGDIEIACRAHGVDAEKNGWTKARPKVAIATFKPTPELVHGVAVSNPYLADYLRRLNAFSGRPLRTQLDLG